MCATSPALPSAMRHAHAYIRKLWSFCTNGPRTARGKTTLQQLRPSSVRFRAALAFWKLNSFLTWPKPRFFLVNPAAGSTSRFLEDASCAEFRAVGSHEVNERTPAHEPAASEHCATKRCEPGDGPTSQTCGIPLQPKLQAS